MTTNWQDMSSEAMGEHQAELADMHDVELGRLNAHPTNAVSCETVEDFIANVDDALAVLESMRADLVAARDDMRTWMKRAGGRP